MRRSSIAAGIILLLGGLAVGYRLGRLDRSHATSARQQTEAGGPVASAPSRGLPESKPRAEDDERSARADESSRPQQRVAGDGVRAAERRPTGTSSWTPKEPPATQSIVEPHRVEPAARPTVPPVAAPPSTPSTVPPVDSPKDVPRDTDKGKDKDKSAAPTDDAESDRRAPVLEFIRFDPPEIQDGAVAALSIGTSDDLSGVEGVVGQIRGPTEDAVVPFTAHDPGGTGVFTASIAIPRHAQSGDWFVGLIQIVDKANNAFNAKYARATVPPGGALRVVSAESDSTPPTVSRIVLEKPTVGGGEKNRVVVEVTDDGSGVASVYGWFESASKSARIPFSCVDRGDGSWVGDLAIPTDADCGEWSLWQLRATDNAQNNAVIPGDSPQMGRVSFWVAGGGGCDSDAPVLDSVVVSPPTVSSSSAAEVTLTISAHDQGSGLSSLEGRIEGPTPAGGQVSRIFFRAPADPKNPDAPLLVKIAIPQYASRGVWRVALLILTDKASNAHTYVGGDPDLANAYFNVE